MKQLMGKIVFLVTVFSLWTSVPVFAVSGIGSEVKEPLTPTAETTWGDVARYFDSQGYEKLPEDIQKQLDASFINFAEVDGAEVYSTGEVDFSMSEQEVSTTGFITPNVREVDLSGVYFVLRAGGKQEEVTYTSSLFSEVTCPYMYVSAILYDEETNKMVGFDSTGEENTDECELEGSFEDLESKHDYRVVSTALLTPPAGYGFSGVAPLETTVTTK